MIVDVDVAVDGPRWCMFVCVDVGVGVHMAVGLCRCVWM